MFAVERSSYLYFPFADKVCLREGKELLSFIERLAGTTELKMMTEEAQTALDELREEVLSLEAEVTESRHRRNQLQTQARFSPLNAMHVHTFHET